MKSLQVRPVTKNITLWKHTAYFSVACTYDLPILKQGSRFLLHILTFRFVLVVHEVVTSPTVIHWKLDFSYFHGEWVSVLLFQLVECDKIDKEFVVIFDHSFFSGWGHIPPLSPTHFIFGALICMCRMYRLVHRDVPSVFVCIGTGAHAYDRHIPNVTTQTWEGNRDKMVVVSPLALAWWQFPIAYLHFLLKYINMSLEILTLCIKQNNIP